MTSRTLPTLLAAVIAIVTAVAAVVVITAGEEPADDAHAQIISASQDFFAANAAGDRAALEKVVCAATMATNPDPQPQPTPLEVVTVAEIVVDGDTATGSMVLAPAGRPDVDPILSPRFYVNEDGWKLCAPTAQE